MDLLSFKGWVIYFAGALQNDNGARLRFVVNLPVGMALPRTYYKSTAQASGPIILNHSLLSCRFNSIILAEGSCHHNQSV
jgi:hypothetical protein